MPISELVEKREAIFQCVKPYGIEKLWVIIPKPETLLAEDKIHLVYECAEEKFLFPSEERALLKNLKKKVILGSEIDLCGLDRMEGSAVICSWEKPLLRARLKNLVLLKDLVADVSLMDQKVASRELLSEAEIQKKMQKTIDDYNKEHPLTSAELAVPEPPYKRIKHEERSAVSQAEVHIPKTKGPFLNQR